MKYHISITTHTDLCEYCFNKIGYLFHIYENYSEDEEALIGSFYLCDVHKLQLERYLRQEELKKDRLNKLAKIIQNDRLE